MGGREQQTIGVERPNKAGRPRTNWKALPPVKIGPELAFRLERRMELIFSKTGVKNISKFVRESISDRLDKMDFKDRGGRG
jgi:hypothetical protein